MDVYTQLENKIGDMTIRMTQEARYFEAGHGHAAEGAGAGQEGGVGQEASKKRYPLVEQPYPDPRFETRDSLAVRAQLSATAFITLNEQVDSILATLPEDEGKYEAQAEILAQLVTDNQKAGDTLRAEVEHAEEMLIEVREALKVMGDDRSRDALAALSMEMEMIARGLVPTPVHLELAADVLPGASV